MAWTATNGRGAASDRYRHMGRKPEGRTAANTIQFKGGACVARAGQTNRNVGTTHVFLADKRTGRDCESMLYDARADANSSLNIRRAMTPLANRGDEGSGVQSTFVAGRYPYNSPTLNALTNIPQFGGPVILRNRPAVS